MLSVLYFCPFLTKFGISWHIHKSSKYKISWRSAEQADRLANMTKLIGAFWDCANALKMVWALKGRAHLAHTFTKNVRSVNRTCTNQVRKREQRCCLEGRVGRCCRLSRRTRYTSDRSTPSFSADPCRPRHDRRLPPSGCHVSGADVLVEFRFSVFKQSQGAVYEIFERGCTKPQMVEKSVWRRLWPSLKKTA
jgi:hypothetical protein